MPTYRTHPQSDLLVVSILDMFMMLNIMIQRMALDRTKFVFLQIEVISVV